MPFVEANDDWEIKAKALDRSLDLVIRAQKIQKDKFDLERNELLEEVRALKREIKWLTERSINHVLGQWLWNKISKHRQLKKEQYERKKDQYERDNYF